MVDPPGGHPCDRGQGADDPHPGAHELHLERDRVKELLDAGTFFWLDVHDPEKADLEILRDEFAFHPLSLEDSWRFGQRPKIDDYDGYVFLVVFGASDEGDDDGLVEVHCFYSEKYLVTLHKDAAPTIDELRERYKKRDAPVDDPARLLHTVVDGLVDGFFPRLNAVDDRIYLLEEGIFRSASEDDLQAIFSMSSPERNRRSRGAWPISGGYVPGGATP